MKESLLLAVILFCFVYAEGQIDGLWVVSRVNVGAEQMTPVAKWFEFSSGNFLSGNGWLQHTYGTYTWNKKTSELKLQSANEPSDGYGAFHVTRKGTTMIWTRREDGEAVTVFLEIAHILPKSAPDEVKGLWDLALATRSGVDVTSELDPESKYYIFLRWDRVFVKRTSSKEKTQGYWHVHGHRPELKLINEQSQQGTETWNVAFDKGSLVLTGVSDNVKDLVLTFTRMAVFED